MVRMRTRSIHRTGSLWLVIMTMLLAALAPSWVQAMMASDQWVEVCSASGSKWVALDADANDDGAPTSSGMGHCPLCTLDQPKLDWPSTPNLTVPRPAAPTEIPELFLAAPYRLFAWSTADARGPPQA